MNTNEDIHAISEHFVIESDAINFAFNYQKDYPHIKLDYKTIITRQAVNKDNNLQEICERQEQFILYLTDQLLTEFSYYKKTDANYRIRQAKNILHNIDCWFDNSVEKPFNDTVLEVYGWEDMLEQIHERTVRIYKSIKKLIKK